MFKKATIFTRLKKDFNRFFQICFIQRQTMNAIQYHSGGDDYNPPNEIEAIGGEIINNPAHSIIIAYKDKTMRISEPGEKRIYATDETGQNVTAEIHLKNNGDILIVPKGKIYSAGEWEHTGNIDVVGTLSADVVVARNGQSATYTKSVTAQNGIVTGGS
ncbi:hypothetical protein IJX73_02950 [bacterium]|nr:hypothetical protein [bacterium]